MLAFAGCAQPVMEQAYDVDLGSRIHTVLLVQGPNRQSFTTIRNWFIPPGNLGAPFALAALADTLISTERITAALDPKQTRLQDRFSELLHATAWLPRAMRRESWCCPQRTSPTSC